VARDYFPDAIIIFDDHYYAGILPLDAAIRRSPALGQRCVYHWKIKPECRPTAGLALDTYMSATPMQDCIYGVQAQASAVPCWFGREKWFEDAFLNGLPHSTPGIRDLQYDVAAAGHAHMFFTSRLYGGGKSPNCQLPSLGHCVSGVHAKVQDDLAEGSLFSKDRLRFTVKTKLNLNMFAN
jgi:hypothetical protein